MFYTNCVTLKVRKLLLFAHTLFLISFRSSNWAVVIARGCGMALNFNCVFVLILMLRYCLTWLRSTRLGRYLPMDQSILFHKMVGIVIFVESFIHTMAHLFNIREFISPSLIYFIQGSFRKLFVSVPTFRLHGAVTKLKFTLHWPCR